MLEDKAAAPSQPDSSAEIEQTFREKARNFGIEQRTIDRMAMSSKRALACVEEARRRGTGPGLAVFMFDAGDDPNSDKPRPMGTNLYADVSCQTCGGDRFVVVNTRKPVQSAWMREHGITPSSDEIEEYAPCPSCN